MRAHIFGKTVRYVHYGHAPHGTTNNNQQQQQSTTTVNNDRRHYHSVYVYLFLFLFRTAGGSAFTVTFAVSCLFLAFPRVEYVESPPLPPLGARGIVSALRAYLKFFVRTNPID